MSIPFESRSLSFWNPRKSCVVLSSRSVPVTPAAAVRRSPIRKFLLPKSAKKAAQASGLSVLM